MNLFRCGTPDGSLDRKYLRVCAVYRLMDRKGLGKDRAIELLQARKIPSARAVVELWLQGPLSVRGRRDRHHERAFIAQAQAA